MEILLSWIKGIIGCLLIMSLILQSVPGKIYRPYLRLFMGIILILTMLGPLTDAAGLEGALEKLVGELAYEEVLPGWEEKLLEGESWAEQQIIAKAEEMSREAVSAQGQPDGASSAQEVNGEEEDRENKTGMKIEIEAIAPVALSGER
ncbi:MAG: stage III sporulation protein AF [Lachnospiraceae bacterium]|nr:stage III sporulation protein AF [Lachnospiraceae bacterium]